MASINPFAGFLGPQRTVFDYQQQLGQIDAGDVATQGARQQLAATAGQLQRDEADRNAFAALMQQSGGNQEQALQGLLSSPSMKLYGQGQAMLKARGDAAHVASQTQQQLAAAGKAREETIGERMKTHRGLLDQVQTPEQAVAWLASQYSDPVMGPVVQRMGPLMQAANQIPTDPQQFMEWKTRAGMGMEKYAEHVDRMSGQQTVHQKEYTQYVAQETAAGRQPKPFEQFITQQRKAGANSNNIDLKIDTKLGESVAGQIGPMLRESYEQANGAQQQVQTADQLIAAVDSKKLLTGPGATLRLKALQIGQALGVGGKDDAETISNTRAAIQGLAQSTLSARAALKGQGQISDNEGKLLERASSGAVDDMTGPEIKQIAQLNKRLAQQLVQLHGQRVQKARANPATAGLSDFYDIVTPDTTQAPPAPPRPGRAPPPKPASGNDLGGGFTLK